MLRDRLPHKDPLKDPLMPIWNNLIYYVNDMNNSLEQILNDQDRPIHANLKWSDVSADVIRVEVYMAQIALQSLAEAYSKGIDPSNIQWFYSYPEAFTPRALRDYKKLFQKKS